MLNPSLFKKHQETLVVIGVVFAALFLAKKTYDFQMARVGLVKENIRKEEQEAITLDRIVILNERLEELRKYGWPSPDFASVVEVLSQLGQEAGMRVQDITPLQKEDEAHMLTIPFFLNAATTYRGLARFLLAVRALPQLLRVHEVTLSPDSSEEQEGYEVMLKMNLKGEAFYFK